MRRGGYWILDTNNTLKTVGLAVIGDEVLLGEITDKNTPWITEQLARLGADLRYSCVLPDDFDFIVGHLNWMRDKFNWIVTTGGIGATHDDLTRRAVARVLGVELLEDKTIISMLEERVGGRLSPALRDLAMLPAGSELVESPLTAAPGFIAGNIVSLPGIPKLIKSMFPALEKRFEGEPLLKEQLFTDRYESEIAGILAAAQDKFPEVKIGSYPIMDRSNNFRVRLVLRSRSGQVLDEARKYLEARVR